MAIKSPRVLTRQAASAVCLIAGAFVLGISIPLSADHHASASLKVEGAEAYQLRPGELLFSDQAFVWEQVPQDLGEGIGLRVELNRSEPVTVHADEPGHLYAVLWTWDFGFFRHAPAHAVKQLNGWALVDAEGASVEGAPKPFSPVPLYRRPIRAGKQDLDVLAYFGQWIVVGYVPGRLDTADLEALQLPTVDLPGARTRHHVYHPGEEVRIQSTETVVSTRLYRHGEEVLAGTGDQLRAPTVPSRYCLQVDFESGSRVVPLVVGLGPVREPGWPKDFFPIHFYPGWWYRGVFVPNEQAATEFEILDQFEQGANTFFTDLTHDLVDALGGRRIIYVRGKTKKYVRNVKDDAMAERLFLHHINQHRPYKTNVLGFYIVDEPSPDLMGRVKILEGAFQKTDEERHLIYCLLGIEAPEFWRIAGSTVRMTRSYPIRRAFDEDYTPRIKEELHAYLDECQSADQNIRFWLVAQAFGDMGHPNKTNRWAAPTPELLRLQINLALSRGTKAITYFCWRSSPTAKEDISAISLYPYVPQDGRYDEVRRIANRIEALKPLLVSWKWVKALPQPTENFDVQLLVDGDGRQYAWVTNWNYRGEVRGTVIVPGLDNEVDVVLAPGGSTVIDVRTGEEI